MRRREQRSERRATRRAGTILGTTDCLPDAYIAMGQTAENVAQLKGISRREQDEYAALSQNRAEQATEDGILASEIIPVTTPGGTCRVSR